MSNDQSIIPHLWFDTQAAEAAELYCSLFPQSKIISRHVIKDTPVGDCDILSFDLWGQSFEAANAGPGSPALNPAISLMINFDPQFFADHQDPEQAARDAIKHIWERFSDGGKPLMELGEYDFSKLYGWIQDPYGMTWQLILSDPDGGPPRPPIMPHMLFVGDNCGKAEEAGNFYQSVFPVSQNGMLVHYPPGMPPETEDTVMFSDFQLGQTWVTAADSADNHEFAFNEAASFIIPCKDQSEIDYFWDKLSATPDAEQSGMLKDRYGVSWQVVPENLNTLMFTGNDKQCRAVADSISKMKKLDIAALHKVFEAQGA